MENEIMTITDSREAWAIIVGFMVATLVFFGAVSILAVQMIKKTYHKEYLRLKNQYEKRKSTIIDVINLERRYSKMKYCKHCESITEQAPYVSERKKVFTIYKCLSCSGTNQFPNW